MRVCFASVVVVLIAASSASAQPPKPPAPAGVTMAELERLALESHPTLRAAQARIDAARGRARQAGAWPNPVIGGSAEEVPLGDTDPRGAYGVFVEQPLLLGGKLRLNRAVFDRTVERSEAELELQRQRIVSTVRPAPFMIVGSRPA